MHPGGNYKGKTYRGRGSGGGDGEGSRGGRGGYRGNDHGNDSGNYRGRGRGRGGDWGNQAGNRLSDPVSAAPLPDFSSPQTAVDQNDVSSWRDKDFFALVRAFVDSDATELAFPNTLTPGHRNLVHRIAMQFRLDHKSAGPPSNRVLKLTKISSGDAQVRRFEAAADGTRIKTIDGFQGAQMLPADFFTSGVTEDVLSILRPFQTQMFRELKVEANRPATGSKRFHAAHPGLSQVPASKKNSPQMAKLAQFRHTLPAYKRGSEIVAAVKENDVVIICGDTGCGKTTQIPQMLHDAGIFPKDTTVVCTQPRRISALAVANRVASERGEACGDSCGYIIRFENVTSQRTRIVYQTTGILLRRLHSEPELHDVSCVIVDEVHERDVETDFCLLLLRDRLRAQRREPEKYKQKLKVVVMSATVQVETLVSYFADCNRGREPPLISIPGTLFPVSEYFLEDAVQWVGEKSTDFSALMQAAQSSAQGPAKEAKAGSGNLYESLKSNVFNDANRDVETMVPYQLIVKLIAYFHTSQPDTSGSVLVFLPGWAAITRIADMLRRSQHSRELSILMLHSSLTSAEQQRVFEPPPRHYRKVVLATSIAETSITIDDVVFVIDSGLAKGTSYDPAGNTSALQAMLIGKANGVQRRGRAGRCRAGVCVHLLPRDVYDGQPDFLPPEIVRSPLDEVCLQVKAIQPTEKCASVLARAMSAPPAESVEHATVFLTEIGAFTEKDEQMTNLGRALAQLPVHPLLGKMLFAAVCFGVLDPIATIAAGLSVKSPFVKPLPHERTGARESMWRLDNGDLSDHLCVLKLYRGWLKSGRNAGFASQHYADGNVLRQLDRTKRQLENLVLRSSLVRRMDNVMNRTSCNGDNVGLIRLVLLWALYPGIATLEFRANRRGNTADVFCWDNKFAQFSMGSVLAQAKRKDIGANSFVAYFERMQLESKLNLFDSSILSPVDVALCLRQLTVRPLASVPDMLLNDDESKLAPPFPLNLEELSDREPYSAMFFDGDKKIYITKKPVASAIQIARECMDYYLALCIKKLRADLFPTELVKALALVVGYPLSQSNAAALIGDVNVADPVMDDEEDLSYKPGFVQRFQSDDSDEDADGPVVDEVMTVEFTDTQVAKITNAFGELAVFRRDGADAILTAAATGEEKLKEKEAAAGAQVEDVPPKNEPASVAAQQRARDDDDDDDDDDIIVAKVGALVLE